MIRFDEPALMEMIAAMPNAGRWDLATKIAISAGADEAGQSGQSAIREGLIDATVAVFPERHGEYVVPAVSAILAGRPVPRAIYVENEAITLANIDRWYPEKK